MNNNNINIQVYAQKVELTTHSRPLFPNKKQIQIIGVRVSKCQTHFNLLCIQISLNNIAAPFAAFESFCFAITLNDVKL